MHLAGNIFCFDIAAKIVLYVFFGDMYDIVLICGIAGKETAVVNKNLNDPLPELAYGVELIQFVAAKLKVLLSIGITMLQLLLQIYEQVNAHTKHVIRGRCFHCKNRSKKMVYIIFDLICGLTGHGVD